MNDIKYISAVDAIDAISEKLVIPLEDLVDVFADVPAADVVPVVHGRWILVENLDVCGDKPYRCSNCIAEDWMTECHMREMKFCPSCGAKMDEVSE